MTPSYAQELESEAKSQKKLIESLKRSGKNSEAYEEESLEEFVPSEPLSADICSDFHLIFRVTHEMEIIYRRNFYIILH